MNVDLLRRLKLLERLAVRHRRGVITATSPLSVSLGGAAVAFTNVATVGHCAKETGMFKFQAKVQSGSGGYKVAVFEKAE